MKFFDQFKCSEPIKLLELQPRYGRAFGFFSARKLHFGVLFINDSNVSFLIVYDGNFCCIYSILENASN